MLGNLPFKHHPTFLNCTLSPLACSQGKLCSEGGSAITSNTSCKAEELPENVKAEASGPRGGLKEGSLSVQGRHS